MPNTPKLPEDERLKKVRDERSSRLNKPPHQKYRKLYRFAEDWFEYHYESRVELKKLIAEVENQEAKELATLKAQVRKEIEELKLVKPQKDNGLTYPVGALHKAYNDALDQALSILKDNHES